MRGRTLSNSVVILDEAQNTTSIQMKMFLTRLGENSRMGEAPSPAYVADFLATSDGLSLTKAFMRIKSSKLRRRIVDLVEQIAGGD